MGKKFARRDRLVTALMVLWLGWTAGELYVLERDSARSAGLCVTRR